MYLPYLTCQTSCTRLLTDAFVPSGAEARASLPKKRRKDKKHKKHKRQRHPTLDKFDKFIQDENLSSGSSGPPSPATGLGGGVGVSDSSTSIVGTGGLGGGVMPIQFPTILGTIAGVKQEREEADHTLSDGEPD